MFKRYKILYKNIDLYNVKKNTSSICTDKTSIWTIIWFQKLQEIPMLGFGPHCGLGTLSISVKINFKIMFVYFLSNFYKRTISARMTKKVMFSMFVLSVLPICTPFLCIFKRACDKKIAVIPSLIIYEFQSIGVFLSGLWSFTVLTLFATTLRNPAKAQTICLLLCR